ncbi:7816_t:CDS:2 [Funneliformis caledonium]|uniref:7816_t:CDS:1 n=1 Tax=Funneliformis caledonium TaxID=1117310 RepID=A0A9N8VSQ4_9GLOM|nr:7816_t:CDS:2 [Funneliformis caledonium]
MFRLRNFLLKDFNKLSFSSLNNIRQLTNNAQATYKPPESILIPTPQYSNPIITNHKDVMKVIILETQSKTPDRFQMFAKHGKDRIQAGDVLLVEMYTSMSSVKNSSTTSTGSSSKSGTTAFAGVCICIKRKGVDTNFTLRNIILKVGVEQKFFINSPLIKSIKILARGEGFRRAKLYYLRDQPGKAFQIGGLIKKEREKRNAELAATSTI